VPLVERIKKKYTYNDYIKLPDEERWELINGAPYNITPAPSINHQNAAGTFYSNLKQKLQGSPCKPFIAPADVVLSEFDVVQPDVFVVCDEKKITDANIQGTPDLIVEVLSPSTALKDKREKKVLYEKYGVKEYIVIDPIEFYIERFVLKEGMYGEPELLGPQDVLMLHCLENVDIPLWEVFEVEKVKPEGKMKNS
jgi:Uma2 family endonuclease